MVCSNGRMNRMRRVPRMITGQRIAGTLRESNAKLVRFINNELDLAVTFLALASDAGRDMRTRNRNKRNARLAYDSATHFLERAELSPAKRVPTEAKLERIKATLASQNTQVGSMGFSVWGWRIENERRHSGHVTIT